MVVINLAFNNELEDWLVAAVVDYKFVGNSTSI